jgi:hypothetical protein
MDAKCLIKYQKKFSEDITQNWNEGSELPRPGRFYRYGFFVEIIKIIGTTEHGSEKPLSEGISRPLICVLVINDNHC